MLYWFYNSSRKENNYEVSNFGRVRNKKGHIIKLQVGTYGYLQVNLDFNGKNKTKKVHRLVAKAFIPNIENKPQVNHIDGNKKNNHINNLEWCTKSYNHTYGTCIDRTSEKQRLTHTNCRAVIGYKENEINKILNSFIDKFELIKINLNSDDFDYNYYVNKYMTAFLEVRNNKNIKIEEIKQLKKIAF